jgi:transposase
MTTIPTRTRSPVSRLRRNGAGGRQPLPRHLKRERIVHDLAEEEKHCSTCRQDLRPIGEESSERYEYIPAQLTVIEDVCKKYACACTVKTATKPPQPIEKSTAGASLLAQVIVAKTADHLPLHRQEKIFERHGVDISRKTMGGWLAQCADLLQPLYGSMKEVLFQSKVIGTDDTTVKVLDVKLPFARTGRIWPYYGDPDHPVILYDYTATRERAGPEEFLKGYRGYLQAGAYGGYDAFFKDPARGLIEVGCWAHARRYFHKALDSDQAHMGPALLLMAQLYRVEKEARSLTAEDRLRLRQRQSQPILEKLRNYLSEIQAEVLPKSSEGRAVRYTLKNWTALTRYCADGDLQIDNNATERTIRGVAVGRNNWVFFGSDESGKTAAVLRSFVASCQRVGVDPFVWLKDILTASPIIRLPGLPNFCRTPGLPSRVKCQYALMPLWRSGCLGTTVTRSQQPGVLLRCENNRRCCCCNLIRRSGWRSSRDA